MKTNPIGTYTRIRDLNPSVKEVLKNDTKRTRPQSTVEVTKSDYRTATPGVEVTISEEAKALYRALNQKGE